MASFVPELLSFSAVMAVIIAVLMLLKKPLGKLSPFSRYVIWSVVILRLCIPVTLGSTAALFTLELPDTVFAPKTSVQTEAVTSPMTETLLPVTPSVTDSVTGSFPSVDTMVPDTDSIVIPSEPSVVLPAVTEKLPEAGDVIPDIQPSVGSEREEQSFRGINTASLFTFLGTVWAIGALVFFAYRMTGYAAFALRMKRSGSITEADSRTAQIYASVGGILGIKRLPRLYVARFPISPMLYGYVKPRIVIPDLEFSDEERIRTILAHELIHHRRGDLYVKLACTVAQSIHWFNPAVYAAASRCDASMELACDAAVLRELGDASRSAYGTTLLDIVRRCEGVKDSPMTTGMNATAGAVKERIMNILDTGKKKRGITLIALTLVFCMIAGTVVGCAVKDNSEKPETTVTENGNGNENAEAVYYVPEYMKIVKANDTYEATLTFEGDKIIAERTKNGESDVTYTAVFDGDRLTAVEVKDAAGELLRTKSLSYDENGKVTLISYKSADNTREYCRTEYAYGDGHLWSITYTEDDEPGRYKITYMYSEDGRLVREDRSRTMYTYRLERVKYHHDSEGRIIKTEYSESDDGIKLKPYESFENTEWDGNRVTKSVLSYDMPEDYSSMLDVKRTSTYTYDSFGNVLTHSIVSEHEYYDNDNTPNSAVLTNAYTADGRYLISQTVEGNYPYFESLLKEYSGKFDSEKLESSGFIYQGTQIKWRECGESEYLRYRAVYETVDTLSEEAERGYLLDADNHMWCFDDIVTDMVEKKQPYEVFEGSDPLNEAEARERWYEANLLNRQSSIISYETLKLSLEAFLMGDYEVFANLQEGTPSANLAYQGLKLGDYKISLNTTDYGVGIMLDFEVLESNNEVLTPGQHRFLTYLELGTYLVHVENDETVPKEYYDHEYHDPIHSALLGKLYEFDEEMLASEEVNMAFTGFVRAYAANWLVENYPELSEERFTNSGSWKLTVDELKDYVKRYYGFEDYEPITDRDIPRQYGYTYLDGYIERVGILGGTVIPCTIDHEQINDDGSVTVTVTHWADMTRTVVGKRSKYTFETAADGTTVLKNAELVYDSGITPAYGNST